MRKGEKKWELLALARRLGDPFRGMAILGEGNVSARLDHKTFLVKASGSCMKSLRQNELVTCRFAGLLALFDRRNLRDDQVESALMSSRVNSTAPKPSVEALFHAYLLSITGVAFVGHTHPVAVNAVLCSPRARQFASQRLFPDEVVCCDEQSVFVPYTDPGLALAQAIREQTRRYLKKFSRPPRVILLANHGIITLGATAQAVEAAMLMAEKAASIWLGAATLGGPIFLATKDVSRISRRGDEALRRKALKI